MSKPNETSALLLALVITGAIVAGGGWWLAQSGLLGGSEEPSATTPGTTAGAPNAGSASGDRLSSGEQILVPNPTAAKQAGAAAMAAGNYAEAVNQFEASLQAQRNDPEALIYLNNARIGSSPAHGIAVATPLGNNLGAAAELLRGIAQAQNEINQAGGINGRPLKVIIADDANQPDTAAEIAQQLAANSEVLAVVGHFSSDSSLAAGEVYQQQSLPMISPTSTSVDLTSKGNFLFRTVPSDRFTASALARYVLETLQLTKAAVFFNANSNYSNSLKDAFTTDLFSQGGEVVGEFNLVDAGFNASTAFQQARDRGAEVLVLLPNSDVLETALQVAQANGSALPIVTGDSAYSAKTLEMGREAMVGAVFAIPWHSLAHAGAAFPPAAQQLWGGEVNWRTVMAYDAAQALAAAIARNPSRQGVQQALADSGFSAPGATSEVRFLPSGDRNQAVQLVTVQAGDRTSFGFEFVPIP